MSALEEDWGNIEEPPFSTMSSKKQKAGRVPPHNIEAEASLLGAMLLSKDAIADALEVTSAEHFYKPSHAHVFDAICGLYATGEPADPVTVADALIVGLLEGIGGPECCWIFCNDTSNYLRFSLPELCKIMQCLWIIGAANEMAEIGYSRPEDVPKVVMKLKTLYINYPRKNK